MKPVFWAKSIPAYAVDIVAERVGKLARRAAKRGLPVPTLTVGEVEVRNVAEGASVEYAEVTISAPAAISLGGWRLAGVVAPAVADGQTVAVISDVPGESNRDVVVSDPYRCDYCGMDRVRSETFLVRHEDGRVQQVGRDCLRDFLGHDPSGMLSFYQWLDAAIPDDDEVESWGRSAPLLFDRADIIRAAARVVTKVGHYVSRRKAEESIEQEGKPLTSTGADTHFVLMPPRSRRPEDDPAIVFPGGPEVEELVAQTEAALAELRTKEDKSEWEWKLLDYARLDKLQARHVGTLASAVILGLQRQERAARLREAAAGQEHETYGRAGERLTIPAEVTFKREFDGNYGTTIMLRFRAERGDLMWWASWSEEVNALQVGDKVTLTGTVKKHEPDRLTGLPVTVLTRCRFTTMKEVAA